jgi:hypothetical protein
MKKENFFRVGVTLGCLGTQYLGAVYFKGLRPADIINAPVACVQFAFVTTYRKEIVILLCLTPRALAETYHLRIHKPNTGPSRYSYSVCTFRMSPHQHPGTLGRTVQHRGRCLCFSS